MHFSTAIYTVLLNCCGHEEVALFDIVEYCRHDWVGAARGIPHETSPLQLTMQPRPAVLGISSTYIRVICEAGQGSSLTLLQSIRGHIANAAQTHDKCCGEDDPGRLHQHTRLVSSLYNLISSSSIASGAVLTTNVSPFCR